MATAVLAVRSILGNLFASTALPHLSALSTLLATYGRVLCVRLSTDQERAFVYYADVQSAQAALDDAPKRINHLRIDPVGAVVLIEGLVATCTTSLVEEYVYARFSVFGAVLGVESYIDVGEVRVYMETREAAERAKGALHKIKDLPESGSTNVPPLSFSPPAPVELLPLEVLLMIFSHLSPRALVLVMRLVSQRWSRVAPHAIKSLDPFGEAASTRLLRDPVLFVRFRHLTHFTVNNTTTAALVNIKSEWRANLRSLVLQNTCPALPDFLKLSPVSAITSLLPLRHLSLQNNAQFLARLSLDFNQTVDEARKLLDFPVLPSLTSLSLTGFVPNTPTLGLQAFLHRQRTTLTELEIDDPSYMPATYLPPHIPGLTRLSLNTNTTNDVCDWINSHSSTLRHLHLRCYFESVRRLSTAVLTSLRSLRLRSRFDNEQAQELGHFLEPCTNLRYVNTKNESYIIQRHLAARLDRLFVPGIVTASLFSPFTALRVLHFTGWCGDPLGWHLPHLHTLHWLPRDAPSRDIDLLCQLVPKFPALRRLSFLIDLQLLVKKYPLVRDHLGVHPPRLLLLEQTLQQAERNGMLRVVLPVVGKMPGEWRVKFQELQRPLRWLEVLSFETMFADDQGCLGAESGGW